VELSALTWYDLLGVLPGTSTQEISHEYSSKDQLAGACSLVRSAFAGHRDCLPGAADARRGLARARRSDHSPELRRIHRIPGAAAMGWHHPGATRRSLGWETSASSRAAQVRRRSAS
jgi:hypothetical protein